jgi:hypothetical protein
MSETVDKKTDKFLDKSAGACYCFLERKTEARLARWAAVMGLSPGKDRKWRRKRLKSLEMDSQMAIRGFGSPAKEN